MVEEPRLGELAVAYAQINAEIDSLGYAVPGTISQRYTKCTTRGCRCRAEPPERHGPYWQYTRNLAGKTVTRRITADQASRYREWIANRRQLEELTSRMDDISRQAIDLILPTNTTKPDQTRP